MKYVMDVREPFDPEAGMGGYRARFEYATEEQAWAAYTRAIAAGFEAKTERVAGEVKERVNA